MRKQKLSSDRHGKGKNGAIKEDAIRFHLLSWAGRERGATKEGAILSRHGAKRSRCTPDCQNESRPLYFPLSTMHQLQPTAGACGCACAEGGTTMIAQTQIAPKNSLLLVMDRDSGEIPESMDGKLVASTPSCIAVGTLSEADGETSVVLANEKTLAHPDPGLRKVFSGILETPKKEVHVCTLLLQTVVKLPVSSTQSNIEIWTDDAMEPSRLCILVDESQLRST